MDRENPQYVNGYFVIKNGFIENVINDLVKCLASLSNPTRQGMGLKW